MWPLSEVAQIRRRMDTCREVLKVIAKIKAAKNRQTVQGFDHFADASLLSSEIHAPQWYHGRSHANPAPPRVAEVRAGCLQRAPRFVDGPPRRGE
jgi:hypothetical protein